MQILLKTSYFDPHEFNQSLISIFRKDTDLS